MHKLLKAFLENRNYSPTYKIDNYEIIGNEVVIWYTRDGNYKSKTRISMWTVLVFVYENK